MSKNKKRQQSGSQRRQNFLRKLAEILRKQQRNRHRNQSK